MSAFPALFYRLGYDDEAYYFLVNLPHMNRSEYPEVSYGIIEGAVCGAMGVKPLASESSIATCSRLTGDSQKAEIKNLPVFDGYITVKHGGRTRTDIENNTSKELTWKVAFMGDYSQIKVNGKVYAPTLLKDIRGNVISEVCVSLPAHSKLSAEVLTNSN